MADHTRLGRGLAALIGDVGEESSASEQHTRKPRRAPIESLKANPRNPRRAFTAAELEELASSIKERGIIQPIVVRQLAGDNAGFEIIAGERRWRAAQAAGLHDVPIAVVDATDAQSLEFAIIENVQRADLNPIEEAAGYVALMEQCNHTQDEVAKIIGKSRPYISNMVRLLKLPEPVKALVRQGKLSAGHARLLVGHTNALVLGDRRRLQRAPARRVGARGGGQARRLNLRRHPEKERRRARKGRRHARARAQAVGRFGIRGDDRPPRRGRHAAYQVQGFGSAGWGVEEVGGLISTRHRTGKPTRWEIY